MSDNLRGSSDNHKKDFYSNVHLKSFIKLRIHVQRHITQDNLVLSTESMV